MKRLTISLLAAAFLLTGCGPQPQASQIAVIDLSAIARATGEDEVIRQRAEAGREELTAQLQQLATNLDAQLADEREKAGTEPSAEDAARLEQLGVQARQQLGQAQQEAQQQATQMESDLVYEFREAVMPVAEGIAKDKGAVVILSNDAYIFWADESINITAEVITAWNESKPAAAAAAPEPSAGAAPAEAPAE